MEKKTVLNLISMIGAFTQLAGLAVYILNGGGSGTVIVKATFWFTLIASGFLLIGLIFRLILFFTKNERMPYNLRNVIENGFVTFGSLIAGVCTLTALLVDLLLEDETGILVILQCVMCFGSWLCFIFGRIAARAY